MLTFHPFEYPYQEAYERVLNAIPPGNFLQRAPFILPYREGLPTDFLITTDVGNVVQVRQGDSIIREFVAVTQTTVVQIVLAQGRNTLSARTSIESAPIIVAAVHYATYLAGWAEQWYFNIEAKLEEHRLQLTSRFGLRAIENQLTFQDLLPATRVMRILAGKLAVKSMLSLGGSTQGVDELVSAVTGTSPVVVPTLMSLTRFEPAVYPIHLRAHDFSGFEFHLWLLNLCSTEWATFVHLCNNLPDDIARLITVTDRQVVVERNAANGPGTGVREVHSFDSDSAGCSVVDILTRFFDCFARIRMYVRMQMLANYAFCAYSYPFDLVVTRPLGVRLFDTNVPFDSGTPLDSAEESDPYATARGWMGLPLIRRFDGGHPLDSGSGRTAFPEDLVCSFDRPEAVVAGSGRLDEVLTLQYGMGTTLTIT